MPLKFTGLTSSEAEASRVQYGANTIPEPAWVTFGEAFLETFRDPMIRILLVMVALMIVMYFAGHAEIYEPIGTIVTVIIVATVTARTNVASDTEYRALRARSAKDTAKVCRDGGLLVLPVDDIVVGDHVILQGGNKIPADGTVIAPEEHAVLHEKLKLAIGMNSAAMYDESGSVVGGNPTDQAVMRFLGVETYRAMQADERCRAGQRQTFNSTNKFSQAELPARGTVVYKGAPEALLARAKYALRADGTLVPFDAAALNEKINAYATRAMRVLAFGYSEQPFRKNEINADVVLIGLAAIRDDVRPEAREAITEVQAAGVQVVMVTGDRRETAVAIARDAGLLRKDSDLVLTSSDLAQMRDDEVQRVLPQLRVIARALPTDKSRIVRLSQKMNLVVGMTGDGVNDSPALRRADVGFAMGSGTEAARDAGDIVILDDNFRSIKDAILYGRTIYNNILKFCRFQLVINIAAVVVSAVAPFFGIIEPLRVTHLLFINLVMDSLGAIMLGNEPAHESYMREKPRSRDANLISPAMSVQIVWMGAWLVLLSFYFLTNVHIAAVFDGKAEHYTAYFLLFVLASLMNGFNVRSTGFGIFRALGENPGFLKVWVMIVLIMAAIINAPYIPHDIGLWIGGMFSTTPIHAGGWVLVFLLAATMIPADMLRKAAWKGIMRARG